ncbi:MAG: bifunctional adenosylcobinamide kinase/adenosylcobinamide-phosphate guanylyltransferase [Muribaculaceae bacterium]|nr:bifunctional adenosylcobinamide kinase/adenosylcobinamide-phosphate guanylyltransferase [Muribaculaceae bacterium]
MVTGGQRSGKSVFAENLALNLSERPVYLATAEIFDEEMRRRVMIHRQRREKRWRNLEESLHISALTLHEGDTVLVDCLTLWASNWFFKYNEATTQAFEAMQHELTRLFSHNITLILVTNEIGLGGVSENATQRRFTDLQGSINQLVASAADEVYLTVSGIPVKIKSVKP